MGFAIRVQWPNRRETAGAITAESSLGTGYNVKVWKTRAGVAAAVARAESCEDNHGLADLLVVYPCDSNGKELS